MHVDRYCMLCVLSSICAAMHKPVSTSMAVKIGDAACGVLLCCFGWLSDLLVHIQDTSSCIVDV